MGIHGQQLWGGMWQSNGSGRGRLAQAEPLSAPCPAPAARLCRWGHPMALPRGRAPMTPCWRVPQLLAVPAAGPAETRLAWYTPCPGSLPG